MSFSTITVKKYIFLKTEKKKQKSKMRNEKKNNFSSILYE